MTGGIIPDLFNYRRSLTIDKHTLHHLNQLEIQLIEKIKQECVDTGLYSVNAHNHWIAMQTLIGDNQE